MRPIPKNIVWITTDHMRYDFIAAHGNAEVVTPNLDRLVGNGISFDYCYANNPVCMPSRCSFMTGTYPQQNGVTNNGMELDGAFPSTVARVLKRGGYHTTQIGKLHFQGHQDHDLDPRAREAYGFDLFQTSEEPGCYEDAYRAWLRGARPDLVDTFKVPRPMSPERMEERRTFRILGAPSEYSHSGWVASHFHNSHAWGAFGEHRFTHLGFYAPHPPLNPTRDMMEPYIGKPIAPPLRHPEDPRDPHDLDEDVLTEYRRHFYGMVTGVDMAVGKVLESIESRGELDDTLIIFSSDHGDACGDHGRTAKGPSYLESIMRLPLILHWPTGFGTEGRREDALVEMIDVLPTITELAGITPDPLFQGQSYAAELLAGDPVKGRPDVYAFHGEGDIMLRNREFKYLAYRRKGGFEERLYDLASDPNEFFNVADKPEYADKRQELRLRAFERTLDASRSLKEIRLRF